MTDSTKSLINKFQKLIMKLNFEFLENKLFQPIGIELSSVPIIIETNETYTFNGIEGSEINENEYPLAYYRPDTDSIHIYIEHKMFQIRKHESEQYALLMFLLFHEANHRLLMHINRGNEKDAQLWNIAADYEIHNTYFMYSELIKDDKSLHNNVLHKHMKDYVNDWVITKNDKDKALGLFEKDFIENVAEEIYYKLLNTKKTSEYTFNSGGSSKGRVIVSEYTLPNGKTISTTDVFFPKSIAKQLSKEELENKRNNELTRHTLMKNNVQKYFEKNKGNISNEIGGFLKKLFHVKIDWKKVLRNSLQTALAKEEYYSWARPRTSLFALPNSPYLPSATDDNSAYGTLIVARDESGSMSDAECAKAAGIIADAKNYYKKIIVLKHDTKISSINEFEELDENARKMLLTRDSCGGTSHKEIFEWINEYDKKHIDENRISCCIFITDMYSDIENYQHIIKHLPKIYLTTPNSAENYDKKVEGVLIPIEE